MSDTAFGQSTGLVNYETFLDAAAGDDAPADTAQEEVTEEVTETEETEETEGESTEEVESETEGEEEKEAPKKEEKAKAPSVLSAVTADGKKIDVPIDAKFTKMVEGKERQVSVKEALDHYAFDVNYTKKYQEVSQIKKEADTKVEEAKLKEDHASRAMKLVGVALNETSQALHNGNIEGFLQKFGELTQTPTGKIVGQLRQYFLPEIEKYLQADIADRKLMDAEEKAKYIEEDERKITTRRETEARLSQYQNFAAQKMKESGVTDQAWIEAEKKIIRDHLGGVAPDFSAVNPYQLQSYVETVILTARANQQDMSVTQLIDSAVPGLNEKDTETYQEIKKTIAPFIGQLENDELIALIKEVAGDGDDLEEELENKADKPLKKKASTTKVLDPEDEDYNPLAVYAQQSH